VHFFDLFAAITTNPNYGANKKDDLLVCKRYLGSSGPFYSVGYMVVGALADMGNEGVVNQLPEQIF
jgi:hypothetical protein